MPEQRRNTDGFAVKLDAIAESVTDMKRVLEKLTDSVNRLGVIEERQSTGAAATERAFVAIEKLEARADKLEDSVHSLENCVSSLKKLEDRTKKLEEIAPDSKRINVWVDRSVFTLAGLAVSYIAKKVGFL